MTMRTWKTHLAGFALAGLALLMPGCNPPPAGVSADQDGTTTQADEVSPKTGDPEQANGLPIYEEPTKFVPPKTAPEESGAGAEATG